MASAVKASSANMRDPEHLASAHSGPVRALPIMQPAGTEPILHGGNLDAARKRFPGAPEPWIDLSTGINPVPFPVPELPIEIWSRLPTRSEEEALLAAAAIRYRVPNPEVTCDSGVGAWRCGNGACAKSRLVCRRGRIHRCAARSREHCRRSAACHDRSAVLRQSLRTGWIAARLCDCRNFARKAHPRRTRTLGRFGPGAVDRQGGALRRAVACRNDPASLI